MWGRSPPGQRILFGLPCVPTPSTTYSALISSPLVRVEREIALLAGDLLDLGVALDVDLALLRLRVPDAEDRLALARLEIQVRAQQQLGRRRHDVLALLVFVDRVREMVGLFEQDMAQAKLRRAPGGAEAGRAGTHDRDLERRRQRTTTPHGPDTRGPHASRARTPVRSTVYQLRASLPDLTCRFLP